MQSTKSDQSVERWERLLYAKDLEERLVGIKAHARSLQENLAFIEKAADKKALESLIDSLGYLAAYIELESFRAFEDVKQIGDL